VHITNTIRQHRPIGLDERLSVDVRVADLLPHPRGRQATLVTTCRVDDEVLWDAETVVLHRESTARDENATAAAGPDLPAQAPTGPQVWRLPSGLGRRYAAVSGDRNPIHLFDVTAMPLGFRHHIAHGMWSKARCLAELENRLPDAYDVAVAFKKPIRLPGRVGFGARDRGDVLDFGLVSPSSGSPHLLGRVSAGDRT
jgi:acyl dehydratase